MSTAVIDNADISEQSRNPGLAGDGLAVREITRRVDNARESATFYKIVALVAAGMLMDSIDVYVGSAVASSALSTGWSTVAQNSLFLSAGFLGLLPIRSICCFSEALPCWALWLPTWPSFRPAVWGLVWVLGPK